VRPSREHSASLALPDVRVLHVITARGGSKGVPGKNLEQIAGLSLIGYKARAAQRATYCARLILSTDDPLIQAEGRALGIDVPFVRPAELATDAASSEAVLLHAMQWVEAAEGRDAYDAIMLLQPSAPFARARDLDGAVELMMKTGANVVLGMREVDVPRAFVAAMAPDGRLPHLIDQMRSLAGLRRQDQPAEYTMNGALFLMRWDAMRATQSRYADRDRTVGYVMDRAHSVDIDSPDDLAWARYLVDSGRIDVTEWCRPTARAA
jgi:CMP-N,N'-diacetyllegionaminic acid synthase